VVVNAVPPPPLGAHPAGSWEDWPIQPGDWQFAVSGTGAAARYVGAGGAAITLACERAGGDVVMTAAGMGMASDVAVHTTNGTENLNGVAGADGGLRVVLQSRAGILDRMAFSRGRFALSNSAGQGAALPAWPEIGRLTEFCRGG
jgi:hypothetical protein